MANKRKAWWRRLLCFCRLHYAVKIADGQDDWDVDLYECANCGWRMWI